MSDAPKVRIALIGVGGIGPMHAGVISRNNDSELIAIVEPSSYGPDKAKDLGVPLYKSVEELLASPHKPDAAIICTPNHTHGTLTRQLVAEGVHVLIEKPVTGTVAEGKEVLKALDEANAKNGAKAIVGHHRRFHPVVVKTRQVLDEGSLGRIVAVSALWMVRKQDSYYDQEWRRSSTAGPILTNIIHDVDLFQYLFGPIVRVQTEKSMSQRGFECEEGAAVILKFASGAIATCLLCDNAPSPYGWDSATGALGHSVVNVQDCYRIFGSQGALSMPDMAKWSYDGAGPQNWTRQMQKEELPLTSEGASDEQLAHFVRVIRGQESPRCGPRDGLAALIACEAIRESLDKGAAVDIEPYDL